MQYGSYSLTRQFVNTYLNRDGQPIHRQARVRKGRFRRRIHRPRLPSDAEYPPSGLYAQEQQREYALRPRLRLLREQVTSRIKWVIDDTSLDSNTSPCSTCIPILRYAEVLLNYAEAKAELGEFSEIVWNATVRLLRERAGVDGKMPGLLRSLYGRLFPQYGDRHGPARDPP